MAEEHKINDQGFYRALLDTALECGIKIISDDFCCKLLAWLYVFGSYSEASVFHQKLHADLQYAQRRLNINGGEIPDVELSKKLRQYIAECGDWSNPIYPDWIKEIDTRYEIKTVRKVC